MNRICHPFFRTFRLLPLCAALLGLLPASSASAQVGDVQSVHDPVIIKAGDSFYIFCTGPGIPVRQSSDLYTWHNIGTVFKEPPQWAAGEFRGARAPWAPDISFFNGTYHLYYAVSRFGQNRSAIGLATNKSLDPNSPDFGWKDQGMVIETHQGDDWNAIDPNLVLDENGDPWLAAGSFWTGIKLRRLDRETGKLSDSDTKLYSLAGRPQAPRAIEAAFIIRHGGFYYLFVSFDQCCRGVNSTYKTMVGRSKSITGPYEDRVHRSMMEGGATLVLQNQGRVRGPGHCAVLSLDGQDWLVHHFYDGDNRGRQTLQIRPIVWDDEDWPLAGEPIARPLGTKPDQTKTDITGSWLYSVDFGEEHKIEFRAGGRLTAADIDIGIGTWKTSDGRLQLSGWPGAGDRKPVTLNYYLSDDGSWFVGRNAGEICRGHKAPVENQPKE